jgi:hypothetical protein
MKYIIIESLEGYHEACLRYSGERIIWRTSSPGLIEKLADETTSISSLEEHIKHEECDSVGQAAFDFSKKLVAYLNAQCCWRQYIDFNGLMGLSFAQLYYVLFYKGLLLAREFEKNNNKLVCVGDPAVRSPISLNFRFDRFDTLFAFLAERSNCGIEVIYCKQDRKRLDELEKWIFDRRMGRWEKLLSIINNTPSSFAYKIWSRLVEHGIMNTACMWPKPKKNVFIHKDCELIEGSFLGLLLHGASIKKMPKLPEPSSSIALEPLPNAGFIATQMVEMAMDSADKHKLAFGEQGGLIKKACADVIAERVCAVLADLYEQMDELTHEFEKVVSKVGKGMILTNAFTSPVKRMFGHYCLDKGVCVTSFEHGITYGLSECTRYMAQFAGILIAQNGVYHWEKSLEDLKQWAGCQRVIIGGIPTVTTKIRWQTLQRQLARRWLGISEKAHVLIYVAGLERNNMVYGPHTENDYQYSITTEAIVEELAHSYPESVIIMKLYPTHRYAESCEFLRLLNKFTNLRIVKDMDFRFIRAAADVIALSSSQSVLGWALGANCKTLFYELEASPVKLSGKIRHSFLPGVRRVIELNNIFKDYHSKSFVKELLA